MKEQIERKLLAVERMIGAYTGNKFCICCPLCAIFRPFNYRQYTVDDHGTVGEIPAYSVNDCIGCPWRDFYFDGPCACLEWNRLVSLPDGVNLSDLRNTAVVYRSMPYWQSTLSEVAERLVAMRLAMLREWRRFYISQLQEANYA